MPEGELQRPVAGYPNKKEIYLTGSLLGPPDTPYAAAKFNVDIIIAGQLIQLNKNQIKRECFLFF